MFVYMGNITIIALCISTIYAIKYEVYYIDMHDVNLPICSGWNAIVPILEFCISKYEFAKYAEII